MSIRPLSESEKLVWAASFAAHYDLSNPPGRVLKPGQDKEWAEWEQSQVIHAIENAGNAIVHLRKVLKPLKEGWGKDSDTYQFAKQMVKQ